MARRETELEKRISLALTLTTSSILLNLLVLFCVTLKFNVSGRTEDIDALAVSVTTIEIFLVIVALGGFWLLRGTVEKAAREEAADLFDKITDNAEKVAREVSAREVERLKFLISDAIPLDIDENDNYKDLE